MSRPEIGPVHLPNPIPREDESKAYTLCARWIRKPRMVSEGRPVTCMHCLKIKNLLEAK
jgi:hypothetical protein